MICLFLLLIMLILCLMARMGVLFRRFRQEVVASFAVTSVECDPLFLEGMRTWRRSWRGPVRWLILPVGRVLMV